MLDWTTIQPLFTWDGSWRDLYVVDTSIQDWQQLIDGLRRRNIHIIFSLDGVEYPLPSDVQALFAVREQASPLLSLFVDHVQINCHFFDPSQIEFDIDPREIADAATFGHLLNFMEAVGSILCKEVRLTPENAPDIVLLRYNPTVAQIETG